MRKAIIAAVGAGLLLGLTISRIAWAGMAEAQSAIEHKDFVAAAAELKPLAADGDGEASYQLAIIYINGDGMPADPGEAIKLLRQAAIKGVTPARQQLAFMREVGLLPVEPQILEEGWRVQVATVPNEDTAKAEWRRWQKRFGEILGNIPLHTQPFSLPDGATVFKVQGGPLTEKAARDACARLRQQSAECMLVRPAI